MFHLSGRHNAPAPANPYPDYAFMAYECAPNDPSGCATFPLATWNASIAWDVVVRVVCAGSNEGRSLVRGGAGGGKGQPRALRAPAAAAAAGPTCATTWVGVQYAGAPSTLVQLFVVPHASRAPVAIHYTLDGSEPSPASPLYVAPIDVAGNATLAARAFDVASGTGLAQQSVALIVQAAA